MCNNGESDQMPVRQFSPLLESLTLSKYNLPMVNSESFLQFRNLRKLHLEANNVSRIGHFAFKGLGKLRELSVQYNPLRKLEKFSFSGLQNVSAILLRHNRIESIEESSFAGSSNIRIILLDHNPIHVIRARAFANLRHVEHLILPSGIKVIEPDAFNGLDSVGLIKLPFMDLRALESFTFRGLNQVHVLLIQESDLGVVKPQAFEGLANVGTLNIINNKIDHLQELRITPKNRIKIVRFLGNHLLQTPSPGTVQVQVVENFTVVANHFPCDCRIHSLLEGPLANGTSFNFLNKNFCISPLEVNGKPMNEIDLESVARCSREYSLGSWGAAESAGRRGFIAYVCLLPFMVLKCC